MVIDNLEKNGTLSAFMIGEKGLARVNSYVGNGLPTDPDHVFAVFWKDYQDSKDERVIDRYLDEVLKVSEQERYCWFALYLWQNLAEKVSRDPVGPIQITKAWEDKVLDNLRSHREYLAKSTEWAGANFKGGLWGFVENFVPIMNRDYGTKVKI